MANIDLNAVVERCREGDEDAWSELVGSTLRPLYRLCASYAPTTAQAEELTQEVFFKLWENLHRFEHGSNFMAWAWRVAKNLLIDAHRRSRREREAAWLDPEIIERIPSSENPHENAERRQRLMMISKGLTSIDEELAQLILMRDFGGMKYQEISDALDIPLGTVKSRLNRARLELATVVRRRLKIHAVSPQNREADRVPS